MHGVGHRHRRRPGARRAMRSPVSATTRGACATGGRWTGCGAHCISTTARTSTAWTSASPAHPPIGVGYLQQPGQPLVELQAVTARETFGDNDLPQATTLNYRRPDRHHRHPRARAGAADFARRAGQPLPAGLGDGHHRRRPHRCRLGRVEPQPALELLRERACVDGYRGQSQCVSSADNSHRRRAAAGSRAFLRNPVTRGLPH